MLHTKVILSPRKAVVNGVSTLSAVKEPIHKRKLISYTV